LFEGRFRSELQANRVKSGMNEKTSALHPQGAVNLNLFLAQQAVA